MGVIFIIISFLVGGIPFGVLVAKYSGLGDITKQGSGNIGATNVLRIGGKKLGLITLILDMAKGGIMVALGRYLFTESIAILAGLAAVLGHIYPFWRRGQGGKGVATALGVITAINWPAGIIVCGTWAAVFYFKRISSLSSIIAMIASFPLAVWFGPQLFIIAQAIISGVVIYRHRDNIRRLKRGEEKPFKS